MSAIHIAIVEDEEAYVQQLLEFVERFRESKGYAMTTRIFRDGEDIIEDYQCEYDIILMDIQMRFMDGMTAARRIREMDSKVVLLFITNMSGYAIQGYEVQALDYVLKPLSYPMFEKKLERALDYVDRSNRHFLILSGRDGVVKLDASTIYYIEARSHQMDYHTKQEILSARGKLDELETELCTHGFFRINRGYLVNLYHITAVKDDCCVVKGQLLPISRKRKSELMERLMQVL